MEISILMVEPDAQRAALVQAEIQRTNSEARIEWVPGLHALSPALHQVQPDLVLSGHAPPGFSAHEVIRATREASPDTPVIVVTGALTEDSALEYLEAGAAEFILLESLPRLGPAVRRVVDHQRTESELRRITRFLTEAQSSAKVGSWEWDIPEDSISWTTEVYRVFGLPKTSAPPSFQGYLDLIHPADRDRTASAIQHALENVSSFEVEHRVVHADGTVRCVFGRGGVVVDRSGAPVRMAGTVMDVTEHRQAEHELRRSNESLRAIFEAAPLAVFTLDADGVVGSWNPTAERLFGWTASEAVGRMLPVVPEDKLIEFASLRRQVFEGATLRGIELVRRRKDGSEAIVHLSAAPLFDPERRVTGILSLVEDVTEVKALEQRLLHSQKMEAVGRLAGGVAHDFNNVLTAIGGTCELLLLDMSTRDPRRADVRSIVKSVEHATTLSRQLLAFSRQQVMLPKVFDLNTLVADLERLLRRLLGEDIDFRRFAASDSAAVLADSGQLEQVIMNLAVNARDAMPRGGQLTVATAIAHLDQAFAEAHPPLRPGSHVVLSVADTGTGMDQHTMAHLFEPFFTTKDKGQGTGLGLATVYGIVEQSGGHIQVDSAPGQGTTFHVYLPSALAVPAERVPEEVSPLPDLGGSETILLVEDDPSVRSVVRLSLQRHGYTVIEAGDVEGAEAISERHDGPIHLLLSDVVMPSMSGSELAARLAERRPAMRILFMSGYPDDRLVHHGVLAHTASYLQKPFGSVALARKVREVLAAG